MEQERERAIRVLDALEDILDETDTTVPCDEEDEEERSADEDAARLYGDPYYELEDNLSEIFGDDIFDKETLKTTIVDEIKQCLLNDGVNLFQENAAALASLETKVSEIVDEIA